MPRVRFISPTSYNGVSYAQNQVVKLSDEDVRALGSSVEKADDVDVEEAADELSQGVLDPDERRELDIKSEPGDAQDVPDALRDEQANAKMATQAKKDKMVKGAKNK